MGCPTPCVGPGCEEDFAGSLAGVLRGSDQISIDPGSSPLESTWATVEGTENMGPDWDLAFGPQSLLVGSPDEGAVRRVRLERSRDLLASDAIGLLTGNGNGDRFGASIDVQFDRSEAIVLLVGAPGSDADATTRDEGAVYLFRDLDPSWTGTLVGAATATVRLGGLATGSALGETVRLCDDMDGDGLREWLIAAPLDDSNEQLAGTVYLVSSRDEGNVDTTDDVALRWTGSGVGSRAGSSLACSDDLTGDGVADLLIGAPFADGSHEAEGALYLLGGGNALVSGDLTSIATAIISGRTREAWLGTSIATGDLDQDGVADLAVGAPGANNGQGEVLVWNGAALSANPNSPGDFRLTGAEPGDYFGRSVAISDLDNDGSAELLVGAPARNPTEDNAPSAFDSGTLYVFSGSVDFRVWRANMTALDATTFYEEERQYLRTGQQIRTGDFDGDGFSDIALLHRFDPDGG